MDEQFQLRKQRDLDPLSIFYRSQVHSQRERERKREREMDGREAKAEEEEEEREIVIVGGGICGLATALALHRKGVRSVVLERSETLRATGAAIGILANGWLALHQLGLASLLRQSSLPLQRAREVWLDKGSTKETSFGHGETRCLKWSDLINTLADALPPHTIHFGCQIVGVLIGCDGTNSVVADFLELKPPKAFPLSVVRGLTKYPSGHAFAHEFVRMRRNNIMVGRIPIDDKSVHWMVGQQSTPKDARALQNPDLIRQSTLPLIDGFPPEIQQMIEDSDVESLSLTRLRYRAPWDLLLGKFRKGTVTVAGDAMHVMGPFLGQGGSAGLEDAIVLARCLYQKLSEVNQIQSRSQMMMHKVGEAMDQYVKERRMRVVRLSMQTYLTGLLVGPSSMLVKLASIVLMVIFFQNQNDHSRYDCGLL
ncbi:Monooxygenase 1 [Camellia lanceoleosa]|uniref:Monooxygenase 1 n=1 Tax=Camellia lanceoleosa TaxID=1840588 RepID=A0ACC0GUV1_9ERIC|nr:Monooxygenase 1 [Camellia lanceoleosa]